MVGSPLHFKQVLVCARERCLCLQLASALAPSRAKVQCPIPMWAKHATILRGEMHWLSYKFLDFKFINFETLNLWMWNPPPCPYKYYQLSKSEKMQLVAYPELQFLAELKRAMYNIQCNAMWAETNMQCALSTWLEPLVEQIEQKKCAMCTGLIHKIICKLIQLQQKMCNVHRSDPTT